LLWRSLYESAAMFWEVMWALVLGFAISALLQVFVSKKKMTNALGKAGLREVALATGFGAASSSCSYAAAAAAKTAFKKGAALVPTLAFMFASTNIVFELGFVLWLLLGWQFVLAELIGAFLLIGFMWLIVTLTLPKGLEQEAREHGEKDQGSHNHMHGTHSKLTQIANAFVMDWSMVWKEIAVGFFISGFLAVLVPNHWWQAAFLSGSGHPSLKLLENVVVGPLIAVASFVCSVGNIPLASVLWSGGISFGGVVSFIYADLIVLPLIRVYSKYYGWRTAIYITLVMFTSMVLSGFVIDLIFSALHLSPTGARPISPIMEAKFAWNYTTWLDMAAIAVGIFLIWTHLRPLPQDSAGMQHHEHPMSPEEHCH
jgi:uncharacterized membrane protein YraQ (UPF0718 family)